MSSTILTLQPKMHRREVADIGWNFRKCPERSYWYYAGKSIKAENRRTSVRRRRTFECSDRKTVVG